VYLVDALHKTAKRLSIPESPTVVPNRAAFGQSDRFVVLGSPKGSPAYLVDAQTGAVTNLIGLGLSKTAFSGEFSPDGSHFVFTGNRLVLVPTADPKAATRLGPEKAGFAGFTVDGTRLGYVDLTDPQHPVAVIEGVDGSDRQKIDLPPHVSRARLVGEGDRLLLEREGGLTVLDVQSGKETAVLSSRRPPGLVWFAPSGRAALVGTGDSSQGGSTSWTWLDLEKGTARALPSLGGDAPILSSDTDPLLFFSDGRLPGNATSFSVLNLETGDTHHVFSFPQGRLIAGQTIAPGGRFALLPVQDRGGGGEL
jgi:hypothetical protein